ncbi:TetR/AcrR family transcriptional regulator [Pedobacter gandavensis]|uniref:TetR family transcriptional regulator n=1 Tax=Pedobacter gandavensis TaxID=2679963 RepID=A0ABR6EVI1_9SPHI|nr:TetR/AcrR family transcriptional regulator [Pedobacter gandavensis]MBB2148966.1 TetR family transcriptional regulator [Pedobacter gandavensis]
MKFKKQETYSFMTRKYDGAIRNKERTKVKLIDAVGHIIKMDGYAGLKLKKIEEVAGVDRKTVYDYFGSIDNLVESYIRQKDYYIGFDNKMDQLLKSVKGDYGTNFMKGVMFEHFDVFSSDVDMQQAILCLLNGTYPSIEAVHEEREKIGSIFLDLAEPFFQGTKIDLPARIAIIVSGIYFMILNKKSRVCGIDLNTPEGENRIKTAIASIIQGAYLEAKKQKADF